MTELPQRHAGLAAPWLPRLFVHFDRPISPSEPKKQRRLKPVHARHSRRKIKASPPPIPHILMLPTELRLRIYEFCFPPSNRQVQLIPYYSNAPRCHLNLPRNIYLVCRQFYHELAPLDVKLRSLDYTFIIRTEYIIGLPPNYFFGDIANNDHGTDDDRELKHFTAILRFAERIRLICSGVDIFTMDEPCTRSKLSSQRLLTRCALRILEIEIRPFCIIPPEWNCVNVLPCPWLARYLVRQVVRPLLGPFLRKVDSLQVNLVHEDNGFDQEFEQLIREYSRPCIPRRAVVEYIQDFREDYLLALMELLPWLQRNISSGRHVYPCLDFWCFCFWIVCFVGHWFDFWNGNWGWGILQWGGWTSSTPSRNQLELGIVDRKTPLMRWEDLEVVAISQQRFWMLVIC